MHSKLTVLIFILFAFGKSASAETAHAHDQHNHDTTATPSAAAATERYEGFVEDLKDSKVAVVDVIGMVCDFCARGVEKAFAKDPDVMKIDVDLELGSVLIAYSSKVQPSERDIDKRIRSNGLDVVDIEIYRG